MEFIINGDILYLYFEYDPNIIRKLKQIPENIRNFDADREAWKFDLSVLPIVEHYLEIPEHIKQQYEIYRKEKEIEREKPDFIINVGISHCYIKPNKKTIEYNWSHIDEVCAIEVPNAKYTNSYKQGTWDGKYHLFNMLSKKFPSGLLAKVLVVLDVDYYKYELHYDYEDPKIFDFQWHLKNLDLRDYQKEAINTAFTTKRGILQLATGAGKTLLSSGLIQRFGVKTLFLVHTKDLLYQAYNVFKSVFSDAKIGIIGDGNVELGDIVIATIQTLEPKIPYNDSNYGDTKYDIDDNYTEEDIVLIKTEKPTNVSTDLVLELLQSTKLLIVDECLTENTLIGLKNGLFKQIKDIHNGDEIVGGIVSNKFEKETDKIVKIRTLFGELEASETHPHFVVENLPYKNRQYWNPNESDIIIKKSNELQVGNYLLIPDQLDHPKLEKNYDNDLLYFVAFVIGDGHLDKREHSNQLKFEFHNQEKCDIIELIFQKILLNIDSSCVVKTKASVRTDIKNFDEYWKKTIWCNSKVLRSVLINDFSIPIGKKSNDIIINNNILNNPLESLKSFVQGCFDSEGWVVTKHKRIGIGYTSLLFIKQLQLILLKFGIKSKIYERKRKNPIHKSLFMLDITGEDLIKYGNKIGFNLPSKHQKMEEILKNIPNRTNNHYVNYNGMQYWLSRIEEIKTIETPTKVYDFTTTDHSFIANGFLTHNCQHVPAQTMYKVVTKVNSPYKFGLSATPYRDDGFQLKIEAGLGKIIFKLSASTLIDQGYLVQPQIKCIRVPQKDYPRKVTYNHVYQDYIVENRTRNEIIALLARQEMQNHNQVLILVKQIKHLNTLQSLIPDSVIIEGKMKGMQRKQIIHDFQTKKFACLIATTLADEGLDVPCLNILILAGSGKSSTKALQRVGRVIRLGDECPRCHSTNVSIKNKNEACKCKECGYIFEYKGKQNAIVYDFIDQTKWLYEQYHKRLDIYETEPMFAISKHNVVIKNQ